MDADFDLICENLFNSGDYDQFPFFHLDEFSASTDNASSEVVENSITGQKRGRSDIESDSTNVAEPEVKQQKSEEKMKEDRLNAITDLISALNQCENDAIENLLKESYSENVVVKLSHHTEDVYVGRNALLLIWVATHESYPDGMYKELEKRYINMTAPRGKAASSFVACPKVEFVYKFSGTRIIPGNVATLIRNFSSKYTDYSTYGPEKLNDKLLQFVAMSEMPFEPECPENYIGEAMLTFEADSKLIKEVSFNILAFDSGR
mmetsp:Transcript_28211/g.21086  ORF Transcript_28211/g.21086 Transcript_28211/m.21086 type:complete len:263 (+) Transcript_28211:127-915(+)|eukprot:CAMPEP_0202978250 /NCGR_PEP_ID=MMETSP1396-20130829/84737_1 /ASSEMBLY_ACC=CAM_ASM_000872 /TAXON_ID= /ORGANISM="Pseudokeronopsis sp., Strain Brazil" /LENGTH=262 /DNA_ID=CAMNT_0049717161 /DNA_START=32 /DNA_END=820 /DNA_ORIENTATION=-